MKVRHLTLVALAVLAVSSAAFAVGTADKAPAPPPAQAAPELDPYLAAAPVLAAPAPEVTRCRLTCTCGTDCFAHDVCGFDIKNRPCRCQLNASGTLICDR